MKNLITKLSCASVLLFCSSAFATLFTVPTAKTQTIQAAIDAANQNGDEIMVLPGVYFEQIDYLGKSVRIYSQGGAIMTFIDGQGTSGPIVTFHTSEGENAILEGFTVRNAPDGAGISVSGSSPTILSCVIMGNTGTDGGGFHCQDANMFLDDCEIKNNTSNDGGGIWMSGGSLTMSNTLLRGNYANDADGGAIFASSTALGISSCSIEDNVATNDALARGGGIFMEQNSSISMSNSIFERNISQMVRVDANTSGEYWAQGGGLYADNSTGIISNTNFYENSTYAYLEEEGYDGTEGDDGGTCYSDGGTLCFYNFSNFQLNGVQIDGSIAYSAGLGGQKVGCHPKDFCRDFVEPVSRGGALFISSAAIFLTQSSFTECSSIHEAISHTDGIPRGNGGAIYSESNGNPVLTNCEITGCSASYNGGGIYTQNTASPFMLNGSISSNTAVNHGGAIYSENSVPLVNGSVIANNVALSGGGIYSQGSSPNLPTVIDTLFCGNIVDDVSGNIFDDGVNKFSYSCGDDCNENGLPDEYDILFGFSLDCNENGVPDECDIANGGDCDGNGIPDECDIADGTYPDCDENGVPDQCDIDCNGNGIPDACDLNDGTSQDCNANSIPDECDIVAGTSIDCDVNGIPDECEPDCNTNGITDACDIADGNSTDCNENGVPDECDVIADCNDNGVNDACDIANGDAEDDNGNWIPDECECPADANGDGFVNVNDLLEIVATWGECEGCGGDVDGDGWVNVNDLLACIDAWGACP